MALILCLETSTKNCSVSLSWKNELLAIKELSSDQYLHSEKLHVFIQQVFIDSGKKKEELSAVAVSKGPGSYTGLRIGVSAAKGFCYALQLPLIAINTLDVLVQGYLSKRTLNNGEFIIPMLDARRMEVYCALYSNTGKAITEVQAEVIEEGSFSEINAKKIHLIGDGAAKSLEMLSADSRFINGGLLMPSAVDMIHLAYYAFQQQKFEDLAYFEPYYLKDFIAGKPKKHL